MEEGRLEGRVSGGLLHANSVRLGHDLDNYIAFGHVLGTLQRAGVGRITCTPSPSEGEWKSLLTILLGGDAGGGRGSAPEVVRRHRARGLMRHISIDDPADPRAMAPDELLRRQAAKKTYAHSLAVTRELFSGTRMGRTANLKEVKQALQSIVDQVLENETSLAGLSALKGYDEYAFTHAVNVCIFCVAMGKRLGMGKTQLYELGMAALVHDLGMSRVPAEILGKGAALTAEERRAVEAHTWLGALSIFKLRDFGGVPYRSMIAAYEHHMKFDRGGYPEVVRPRDPSIFSRIIAVADAFDAATNTRAYTDARPADEVLGELWENAENAYDPVVVKALINLLGIYPVGTLVILDTLELAIVHQANPDTLYIHRPIVRVISSPDGTWLDDAPLADLAEVDDVGQYRRSIIKVTDPAKYGVQVSRYFL
jgi:HD-GYP domain-containing protein (c-di-GMP phosphodiesterase class II)